MMSDTALLVIDMLNSYEHEDADALADSTSTIIDNLVGLVGRGNDSDSVDVIYVNDNYGDFTATRDTIVQRAIDGAHPELVAPIVPEAGCAFLQKVRHSAFYATSLDYLLGQLEIKRIVLAGQVTEQCILYSALDAYVRHFEVIVPRDAVAHIDADLGGAAIRMMESNMRARVVYSGDLATVFE
jgi:nicotinamidase-related amidase